MHQGTYTFPATTVTVNETTTAVVPSTTACTPGVYTLGGVTTYVFPEVRVLTMGGFFGLDVSPDKMM